MLTCQGGAIKQCYSQSAIHLLFKFNALLGPAELKQSVNFENRVEMSLKSGGNIHAEYGHAAKFPVL